MKVMVKDRFIDKHTGEIRDIGSIFECSEDRLKEIQSVSSDLVSVVLVNDEEPKESKAEAKAEAKTPKKRTTKKKENNEERK